MLKTFDLVKIFLKERNFSAGLRGKKDTEKTKNSIGMIIFLVIIFLFYTIFFTYSYYNNFSVLKETLENYNEALFSIVGLVNICSLFFILLSGNNLSLSEKDSNILGVLPIDEKKILSAKLIVAFIYESFFQVFIGLTALIGYLIVGGCSLVGILTLLLTPILSAILPMCILSFLILWAKKLVSKSKYKRILEIFGLLIGLVFIMAYAFIFGISTEVMESETVVMTNQLYKGIMTYYPGLILVKMSLENNTVLWLLLYALALVLILIVYIALFNKFALKLMLESRYNVIDNKKSKVEYKKESIRGMLIKKEFNKMFSSNIYLLNTILMPIIFSVGFFVLSIVYGNIVIELGEGITVDIFKAGSIFVIIMANITITTCSFSLSLENEYIWIIKSLPIDYKLILREKILFNMILQLSSSFIIILGYIVGQGFDLLFILLLIIFSLILSYSLSIFQQFINLRYPTTEVEDVIVVKQSKSVMIASLTIMPIMFVCMGILAYSYFMFLNLNISILVTTVPFLILALIFGLLVRSKGKKLFMKL